LKHLLDRRHLKRRHQCLDPRQRIEKLETTAQRSPSPASLSASSAGSPRPGTSERNRVTGGSPLPGQLREPTHAHLHHR
jgi:hypothetical protein